MPREQCRGTNSANDDTDISGLYRPVIFTTAAYTDTGELTGNGFTNFADSDVAWATSRSSNARIQSAMRSIRPDCERAVRRALQGAILDISHDPEPSESYGTLHSRMIQEANGKAREAVEESYGQWSHMINWDEVDHWKLDHEAMETMRIEVGGLSRFNPHGTWGRVPAFPNNITFVEAYATEEARPRRHASVPSTNASDEVNHVSAMAADEHPVEHSPINADQEHAVSEAVWPLVAGDVTAATIQYNNIRSWLSEGNPEWGYAGDIDERLRLQARLFAHNQSDGASDVGSGSTRIGSIDVGEHADPSANQGPIVAIKSSRIEDALTRIMREQIQLPRW